MATLRKSLLAMSALAILLLIVAGSVRVASQVPAQFEPRFSRALAVIHQAETSGATADEVKELVALLNRALELNDEAAKLTGPTDAGRRAEVLAQLDQLLGSLETKAGQLEAVSSQRAFMNRVLAYVSGGIVAVLATLAYAYGDSFYRRYRIKRTFQMRIHPK